MAIVFCFSVPIGVDRPLLLLAATFQQFSAQHVWPLQRAKPTAAA